MEALEYFTCLSYDNVDFLIQNKYVKSGIYLQTSENEKSIKFNTETLPHIYIGDILENQFYCKSVSEQKSVLVFNSSDFSEDVNIRICKYTETSLPHSGNLALSVSCALTSKLIDLSAMRTMPANISGRMNDCGINAICFSDSNKQQLLISPDSLMRKFFTGDLL